MKKLIILALLALTSLVPLANAQDDKEKDKKHSDEENKLRFWEASLPGGDYMVALNRISSISMHSYLVNSHYIVYEVVIDTDGAALARFYAIELVGEKSESNIAKNLLDRGKEIVQQGGGRVGVDTNTLVEKKTPAMTHAKTIEYRVFDKSDLDQLFGSAKKSWRTNRGRKFTIK